MEFRPEGTLGAVTQELAREASRIVHEALVNAARHGEASFVRLSVSRAAGELRLAVADNGRGLPFHGVYELAELVSRKIGPMALRERVRALGGTLRIDSSPSGARLDIGLPLPGEGASR